MAIISTCHNVIFDRNITVVGQFLYLHIWSAPLFSCLASFEDISVLVTQTLFFYVKHLINILGL